MFRVLALLALMALPATADDAAIDPRIEVADLRVGSGEVVEPGSLVTLHFTGRLADGTVFETTLIRATPVQFRQGAGKVFPGWDQGLLGMRVGGRRTLVVPPELAYGDREVGNIPANATLSLELTLLAVEPPRRPPALPDTARARFLALPASGVLVSDLAEGTGRAAAEGDKVLAELTAWDAEGNVVDSTWNREGPEPYVPGGGRNHPDLEAALVGLQPGARRLVKLRVGEDQPPWLALVEVADVVAGRRPPSAPTDLPEDAYVTLPSGLKYTELVPGTGPLAKTGDTVVVEYTGWLAADGTMFDSSYTRPDPFEFRVGAGQVIDGWDEGVAGMRIGGTRQLVIPFDLAYGSQGSPPTIPPFSTLIFEVTLLEVR